MAYYTYRSAAKALAKKRGRVPLFYAFLDSLDAFGNSRSRLGCYVYFLCYRDERVNDMCKIGYSIDVGRRVLEIEESSGFSIDLLSVARCYSRRGQATDVETILHVKLSPKRIKGEWFSLNNEEKGRVIDLFASIDTLYGAIVPLELGYAGYLEYTANCHAAIQDAEIVSKKGVSVRDTLTPLTLVSTTCANGGSV